MPFWLGSNHKSWKNAAPLVSAFFSFLILIRMRTRTQESDRHGASFNIHIPHFARAILRLIPKQLTVHLPRPGRWPARPAALEGGSNRARNAQRTGHWHWALGLGKRDVAALTDITVNLPRENYTKRTLGSGLS